MRERGGGRGEGIRLLRALNLSYLCCSFRVARKSSRTLWIGTTVVLSNIDAWGANTLAGFYDIYPVWLVAIDKIYEHTRIRNGIMCSATYQQAKILGKKNKRELCSGCRFFHLQPQLFHLRLEGQHVPVRPQPREVTDPIAVRHARRALPPNRATMRTNAWKEGKMKNRVFL